MIRAALNNPYAVVAISLIVVILGAVSYQTMVVDIFPEINLPVVAVATFYKGMGPSEVEGAITLRLEQLFLQASYVEHIESRSLPGVRSEEHTSELQSQSNLVCRLLLEKKK